MTKDYFSHLTPKEQHILKDKGTEAPFKGEYNEHFDAGIFICRACENPLYESNTKFNSGCGWPSIRFLQHSPVSPTRFVRLKSLWPEKRQTHRYKINITKCFIFFSLLTIFQGTFIEVVLCCFRPL